MQPSHQHPRQSIQDVAQGLLLPEINAHVILIIQSDGSHYNVQRQSSQIATLSQHHHPAAFLSTPRLQDPGLDPKTRRETPSLALSFYRKDFGPPESAREADTALNASRKCNTQIHGCLHVCGTTDGTTTPPTHRAETSREFHIPRVPAM